MIEQKTGCQCNQKGSKNNLCNKISGDCDCQANVCGQKCDQCCKHYFGFPDCKGSKKSRMESSFYPLNLCASTAECKCFSCGTKEKTTCSSTGKCTCKPGYVGDYCTICNSGYYMQKSAICQGAINENRANHL